MALGEKIKEYRHKAGMSQEKLAELAGVSRQAVTKWESGQSAPSTENLFRLSEIFGASVDELLAGRSTEGAAHTSPAEEIYYMYRMEEKKRRALARRRLTERLKACAFAAAAYLIYYLLGRILCVHYDDASFMGLLLGNDWLQIDYLYGWLLSSGLFWIAMGISIVISALGKYRCAASSVAGFGLGWLLGHFFGPVDSIVPYHVTHYGWLIWAVTFTVSIVIGIILEHRKPLCYNKGKNNI